MPAPADSYSDLERRLLEPAHRVLQTVYAPVVWLLARLGFTPNAVSLSQVPLAILTVALIPTQPHVASALFVVTLALDGIDGALARATNRATTFGALLDQYADHIREVLVVAGLAAHGALHPAIATLYGLAYPAFNFTLYVCNAYGVPLPIAIKSYLTFYPALFAYLWWGVNVLDVAGALAVGLMGAVIAQGLWRLRAAMDAGRPGGRGGGPARSSPAR